MGGRGRKNPQKRETQKKRSFGAYSIKAGARGYYVASHACYSENSSLTCSLLKENGVHTKSGGSRVGKEGVTKKNLESADT